MKPTLLILAAGLGTRYGGLKQIDPIGPNGEIIIDYSIYDAISAGFGKLVFVIQHYFEDSFRKKIGSKFDGLVQTAYAYQEMDACLDGFKLPRTNCPADSVYHQKFGFDTFSSEQLVRGRVKPWGTGHAILVAGDIIHEPFAVINADDYYGPNSFKTLAGFLTTKDLRPDDYTMVGFTLRDTLSEYGPVARGICQCDERMFLRRIAERKKVEKTSRGARYFDKDGTEHSLTGSEVVSMNLWGFQISIFHHLQSHFRRFLKEHGNEKDSELFIPAVIDELVESGKATVKVLRTNDIWFGVTFRRDAITAARCIRKLIEQRLYPENLWE